MTDVNYTKIKAAQDEAVAAYARQKGIGGEYCPAPTPSDMIKRNLMMTIKLGGNLISIPSANSKEIYIIYDPSTNKYMSINNDVNVRPFKKYYEFAWTANLNSPSHRLSIDNIHWLEAKYEFGQCDMDHLNPHIPTDLTEILWEFMPIKRWRGLVFVPGEYDINAMSLRVDFLHSINFGE